MRRHILNIVLMAFLMAGSLSATEGILINEDNGRPIVGAILESEWETVVTDRNGVFEFERLDNSEGIKVYYNKVWIDEIELNDIRLDDLTLGVNLSEFYKLINYDGISNDSKSMIYGFILDQDGRKLNDVDIEFKNSLDKYKTDYNGKFKIEDLKPDKYVVEFSKDGYIPIIKEFELRENKFYELNIELKRKTNLELIITNTCGFKDIEGSITFIRSNIDKDFSWGKISNIEGINSGNEIIEINAKGYIPLKDTIEITEYEVNKKDYVLLNTKDNPISNSSIELKVLDEEGEPAVGATVSLLGTNNGTYIKENGIGIINCVKQGESLIKITFIGYNPLYDTLYIEENESIYKEYSLETGAELISEVVISDKSIVNKSKVVTSSSNSSSGRSGSSFSGGFAQSSSGLNNPLAPQIKSSRSSKTAEPDVSAGQLTAGELNDFRKWEMWNDIAENDLNQYVDKWKIEPLKRYSVQLVSLDNKPIIDTKVNLVEQTGNVIWSARSDNTGKAELWTDAYKTIDDPDTDLFIEVEHKDDKQIIRDISEFHDGINFVRINDKCSNSKNVDIVFAMDATGSMGDEIEYLKSELLDIISKLEDVQSDKNIRVGSIFYRDYDYPKEELLLTHDLSSDLNSVNEFINKQVSISGSSTAEAVETALSAAVNEFSWSEDAVARVMFLILDAAPHDDETTLERFRELTARASEMGIRVIPLVASGIQKDGEYLMRSLALLTNGTYLFLTDDSGIGNDHIEPTTDSYDVEKMNELLVRVIKQFIETPSCENNEELYAEEISDNIYNENEVRSEDISSFVNVYPNPTNGQLTIDISERLENIFVVDMNGKILSRLDSKKGKNQINLSDFPTGIYFLKYAYQGNWSGHRIQLIR